jgi:hypothetical protein
MKDSRWRCTVPADRLPKRPAPSVRQWAQFFASSAKQAHLRINSQRDLIRLAALVAIVGPPTDPVAQEVYWAMRALFLHPKRLPRWGSALDVIPPDRDSLLRLLACVKEFGTQMRSQRTDASLTSANFQLDQVIGVMIQVNDPGTFVGHCFANGLNHPGACFHPNTLRRATQLLRGSLGMFAEAHTAHDAQFEFIKVTKV